MNDQEQPVDLSPYINVIQSRFVPAQNRKDATHHFSTAEVKQAIKQLNPGLEVNDSDVYDAMIEAGFIFDTVPGAQSLIFKWLLIQKAD